jgi:hypothetical protein
MHHVDNNIRRLNGKKAIEISGRLAKSHRAALPIADHFMNFDQEITWSNVSVGLKQIHKIRRSGAYDNIQFRYLTYQYKTSIRFLPGNSKIFIQLIVSLDQFHSI